MKPPMLTQSDPGKIHSEALKELVLVHTLEALNCLRANVVAYVVANIILRSGGGTSYHENIRNPGQ